MARRLRVGAALLGSVLVLSVMVFSHPDDPKVRDRRPPYRGPGYATGQALGGGKYVGASVNFPSSGVTLLSWLSLSDFPGTPTSGADCWGYVSPSGREYALIGLSNGTAFVEITNPSNPVLVALRTGPTSLWRDVQVYQGFAYAVSEGGDGIQVFDLRQIDQGNVTFVRNVTTPGTTATHTVIVNEQSGYLYRCGGSENGLRIYSLANPDNPTYVSSWSDRYVHEAHVVSYTSGPYAGKEIAFCNSGFNGGWTDPGLDILDVTNKTSIVSLAHFFYPNPAYSHQSWLSEDRQLLYVDDELDESGSNLTRTIIINVSNLSNPFTAGSFNGTSTAVGHNLYVRDNHIYEANYRSGLRVFDATNPLAPVEERFFDTWPEDDQANFNGLWGNYPFFPSGVVIGSDLEKGLFVWWPNDPLLRYTYPNGLPNLVDPFGDPILIDVTELAPGDLLAGSFKLFYDAGSGFVEAPVADLGNNRFEARLPALACGTQVEFYVTAKSTNGISWNDPPAAPANAYHALVANSVRQVFADNMETDLGWTVGASGDNATTGIWVRVNPRGTSAQPEDDHSEPGTVCWVTGQGPVGGGDGDNDVDGGTTTLVSPALNLASMVDPQISYWRWYSNDKGGAPNEDTLAVQISQNGTTWVNVETVGPSGPETSGGWIFHQFRVRDFITPSSQVKVRVRASDLFNGSIVEAAIDDFSIIDVECLKQSDRPKSIR